MKYPRILAALQSARWAVTPETLQAIRDTLSARLSGKLAVMDDYDDDDTHTVEPFEMITPGVAVVQLAGIIGKNLSSLEMMCGGCDIGRVEQNLAAALASPGVGSVILHISSPGGTVNGVAEFSAKISTMSAESGKPVHAYMDEQGCSAAYWIACGCNGIACSPSSDVGSIGIYMALVDESENWAKEGYRLVLIKSGEFKAAGMPGSKITDAQIALWQADVDYIYAQFSGAVKETRPNVSDDAMRGQVFYGPMALAAGLVDKIVPDLNAMAEEVSPSFSQFG
jgi:signal peptide peptidase SppA